MNIIKLILAVLGAVFVGILVLSVLGWLGSILSWVFWLGLIGLIGYGGYRLFLAAERRALGSNPRQGIGSNADIPMSWDEYDKKYLHK